MGLSFLRDSFTYLPALILPVQEPGKLRVARGEKVRYTHEYGIPSLVGCPVCRPCLLQLHREGPPGVQSPRRTQVQQRGPGPASWLVTFIRAKIRKLPSLLPRDALALDQE
jgi:hypothetical protein